MKKIEKKSLKKANTTFLLSIVSLGLVSGATATCAFTLPENAVIKPSTYGQFGNDPKDYYGTYYYYSGDYNFKIFEFKENVCKYSYSNKDGRKETFKTLELPYQYCEAQFVSNYVKDYRFFDNDMIFIYTNEAKTEAIELVVVKENNSPLFIYYADNMRIEKDERSLKKSTCDPENYYGKYILENESDHSVKNNIKIYENGDLFLTTNSVTEKYKYAFVDNWWLQIKGYNNTEYIDKAIVYYKEETPNDFEVIKYNQDHNKGLVLTLNNISRFTLRDSYIGETKRFPINDDLTADEAFDAYKMLNDDESSGCVNMITGQILTHFDNKVTINVPKIRESFDAFLDTETYNKYEKQFIEGTYITLKGEMYKDRYQESLKNVEIVSIDIDPNIYDSTTGKYTLNPLIYTGDWQLRYVDIDRGASAFNINIDESLNFKVTRGLNEFGIENELINKGKFEVYSPYEAKNKVSYIPQKYNDSYLLYYNNNIYGFVVRDSNKHRYYIDFYVGDGFVESSKDVVSIKNDSNDSLENLDKFKLTLPEGDIIYDFNKEIITIGNKVLYFTPYLLNKNTLERFFDLTGKQTEWYIALVLDKTIIDYLAYEDDNSLYVEDILLEKIN